MNWTPDMSPTIIISPPSYHFHNSVWIHPPPWPESNLYLPPASFWAGWNLSFISYHCIYGSCIGFCIVYHIIKNEQGTKHNLLLSLLPRLLVTSHSGSFTIAVSARCSWSSSNSNKSWWKYGEIYIYIFGRRQSTKGNFTHPSALSQSPPKRVSTFLRAVQKATFISYLFPTSRETNHTAATWSFLPPHYW